MAEVAEETEVTEPVETSGERDLAGAALQSALGKERTARKDLEKRLRAAEDREREREDAEKSEVDRLRASNERLEAERTAERAHVEKERVERERTDRVRRAAGSDFADVDDVIAVLGRNDLLEGIESDADAVRALKALGKDKPHLLRPKETPGLIDQVLKDGQVQPQRGPENAPQVPAQAGAVIPFEALNVMSKEQLESLRETDYGLYDRSMNALSGLDSRGKRVFEQ